jgi:DNA-binding transcriptional regulator YiaG
VNVQKLQDAVKLLGDAALDIATALSAFTVEELSEGEFKRPGDPKPVVVEPAPRRMNIKAAEPLTAERFHGLVTPSSIEMWVLACCEYPDKWAAHHSGGYRSPKKKKPTPKAAELYASFEGWCRATDTPCQTQKSFSRAFNKTVWKDRVTVHGRGPGHPVEEKSYVTGKVLSSGSTKRRRASRKNAKRRGFDLEHWSKMVRSVRLEELKIGRTELARMLQVSTDSVNQWEAGICFATSEHRQMLEVIANSMSGVEARAWKKPA